MEIGISVYPDFYDFQTLKTYIGTARENGCTRAFVSLVLEDMDFEGAKPADSDDFRQLFDYCHKIGIEVAADINEEVFYQLGASVEDLSVFKELKIPILRIDGGFNEDELVKLIHNNQSIKVEMNASNIMTCNKKDMAKSITFFERLHQEGGTDNLLACFNFFPRINTGHSLEDVQSTIDFLHQQDIQVGGFVASQLSTKELHPRGHGIPTVESHRYAPVEISGAQLRSMGMDYVIIGDAMAPESEVIAFGKMHRNDYLTLSVIFNRYVDNELKTVILETIFESRKDQPTEVIRSTNLRGKKVLPCYTANRSKFSVTVDNVLSTRYSGELQLLLKDMDRVDYTNVIGLIHPEAQCLVQYLKYENNKFKLIDYSVE